MTARTSGLPIRDSTSCSNSIHPGTFSRLYPLDQNRNLQHLTNKLSEPTSASFDGERVLVTNLTGNSVTVFKAADLSVITVLDTFTLTSGACSDGINFWVNLLNGTGQLLRF